MPHINDDGKLDVDEFDAAMVERLKQSEIAEWAQVMADRHADLHRRVAELRGALQGILDWADLALSKPDEFDSHGVRNLDGPAFDHAREVVGAGKTPDNS